jgi:hypothetical protein
MKVAHFSPWRPALILLAALILAGCGSALPAGTLPTLPATETAAPHATATFMPLPTAAPLPEVDWSDISLYSAAMRPEYVSDLDGFVNRNRYYIEATLELGDVVTLYGAERVRYTNRSEDTLAEVVFRLYPNLDAFSGQMNILDVTVDGQAVIPTLEERRSVLRVPLPTVLAPGDSAELVLQFNSAIEAGFSASYGEYSFQRGVYTAPEWYPVLSVYESGHGWWTERARNIQGEQTYTETGLYEVKLTADAAMTVVLSGSEIETIHNGDGTLTHHVISGPMRDSILIGSYSLSKVSGEVDGITVNMYYWNDPEVLQRSERAANAGLTIAENSLATFNRDFGEYPFIEFDVVQTNTGAGGIEYPGVIVVADNFWNTGTDFFETVIAHEAGHQWWYSLVGNNQVAYPFLDESLTSFSEYVYYWAMARTDRQVQQATDFVRGEQMQYNAYVGSGNPDLPLGLSTDGYVGFQYTLIIYTKGPIFFNEITDLIGRDEMYRVLHEYFRRYKYEVATIEGMLQTFEDVTGRDWDQMFYEWVGDFPGLDPSAIATVNALQSGG